MRIAVAKGKFKVPESIDFVNEVIRKRFTEGHE